MKNNFKSFRVFGSIKMKSAFLIFGVFVIIGCASMGIVNANQANVEDGRAFVVTVGDYDSSKPLEAHSFLVHLSEVSTSITQINGRRPQAGPPNSDRRQGIDLMPRQITILQPGIHNIQVFYDDSISGRPSTGRSNTGSVDINFSSEAGKYYYLSGGRLGDHISYQISELVRMEGNNVLVPISVISEKGSVSIPAASVIMGMETATRNFIR